VAVQYINAGWENVAAVEGGINAWRKADYPMADA
jgi:rhodanese-related sulfurtransferase